MQQLSDYGEIAWLDSAADASPASSPPRHSLLCVRPCAVLRQFDSQPATLQIGNALVDRAGDGWQLWRRLHSRPPACPPLPWGLSPGWVGYVGFEMARYLEALPASHRADLGLPLMRLALFDRGIVLDHAARRAFAVRAPDLAKAFPGAAWGSDREWLGVWSRAARVRSTVAPVTGACSREMERDTFERLVARAIEYIRAGDIYQVNLSHRFRLAGIDDPLVVYAAVRRANPAPYAALLSWDDGAVASASPELFLRVRDRAVRTQPIKGTRPRTGIPARDELLRRELLASPKEAAELTMIVDLHRNDLGRVCEYGSVRVAHARRLEAHPTVFHTVADIAGRLAPGRDALDLLMACFPAGSISGVPKIRALQIIDELEPVARGVYTGAIGVLGLDGQMTLNVAIRTLQIRGGEGTLYVGGGIVADSDPSAEYEETIAKARGILTGLQRTGQSVDFAQTA